MSTLPKLLLQLLPTNRQVLPVQIVNKDHKEKEVTKEEKVAKEEVAEVAKERGKAKSVKWLASVAGAVSHWRKSSSRKKLTRLQSMEKEIDTLLSSVVQPRVATRAVMAIGRMQKLSKLASSDLTSEAEEKR